MTTLELLARLRDLGVKLWAEGDKLRFQAPKGVITPELREALAEHKEAVLAFVREIATPKDAPAPIQPANLGNRAPLSFSQQRLWFLDQFEPGSPFYNVLSSVRLLGRLDVEALRRSFELIIARHAVLRTTFDLVDGQPVQLIAPAVPLDLEQQDFRRLPEEKRDAAVQQAAIAEARRPFDLRTGPLVRAALLQRDDEEFLLLVTMHHIISDGWSVGVMTREFVACYAAFAAGRPPLLPELPIQYADYAVWQRNWLEQPDATGESPLQRQLAYWRRRLGDLPAALELPTDRPRPSVQTFNGATLWFEVPPALTTSLQELSQREGASLFMTLLAAFQTLLFRWSGQEDMAVGSPIANRTRTEVEPLIGFFVNTLVLRGNLAGNPTFRQLLARVRETTLGAYEHQDLPFERLVEELRPDRDMSRSALFQVMMVLQNAPMPAIDLHGLTLRNQPLDIAIAKFDLELWLFEVKGGLRVKLDYNTDLFDDATIARFAQHYTTLLAGAAADPDRPIGRLPLLTEAEREQLAGWNTTARPFPLDRLAHQRIADHAARYPQALAVADAHSRLSFAELDARADRLAHFLRAHGVGPDVLVGVCLDRSVAMVLAELAVLKAGGAYVPMDPAHPAERLAFLAHDAQVALLLTQQRLLEQLPTGSVRCVCLDTDWPAIAQAPDAPPAVATLPEHLAYVIYTSGSTGTPKGVAISHASLLNLIDWHQRAYSLTPEDGCTQLAGPGFDASVWEIWPALTAGAALHIADETTRLTPDALRDWLLAKRVAVCFVPTPMAEELIRLPWPRDAALRFMLTGGDRLSRRPPPGLPFALVNHYGPTECTVLATAGVVEPEAGQPDAPVIGTVVSNTALYVLDRHGQPVPVGVPGELHIGGTGVARGYWNRPELTAERFIPNPFGVGGAEGWGLGAGEGQEPERATAGGSNSKLNTQHSKLYKTGDLVRFRPDGAVEFLGRIDAQVKLRGFRIELGEIEATLRRHPDVREAVVLAREDGGDKRLVAYVMPAQKPRTESTKDTNGSGQADAERKPQTSELRAFLAEQLPEYMVPAAFVWLDALPLTPNGKLDRKALPAPEQGRAEGEGTFVAPRTPVEAQLAELWASLLHLPQVGVEDNFFELGGHSLLATQLVSRVRETFGVELPLRQVFAAPTVAGLAALVDKAGQDTSAPPIEAIEHDGPPPLSFSQERLWFLDQLEPGSPLYNIPAAMRFTGPLDEAAFERSINTIVARHDSVRTTFTLVNGRPVQVIAPPAPFPIERLDLRGMPAGERETRIMALANAEAQRPFDLARGPLLRVVLAHLAEDEHVVLFTMHHIIADGWSVGVIMSELVPLYSAFVRGEEQELPPLPIQYSEFAIWQRTWLQGEQLERQIGYWKGQLGNDSERGGVPLLNLPTDRPRPPMQTYNGNAIEFRVSQPVVHAITALSQHEQVTPFMTTLAVFQVLLARWSGQDDIAVGTPIANRNRKEIEPLIGCFINTLVLRGDLRGNPSFRELLARVRQTTLGAYDHQDLPFEVLVDALRPARQLSHNALFQVLFVLQNMPGFTAELGDTQLSALDIDTTTIKTDLALKLLPQDETMLGLLEYNTDLFDRATAERMLAHFLTLLETLVSNPDQTIAAAPLLTEAERQQLAGWNATAQPFPQDLCFHTAFEAQVERTPGALALVAGGEQLTFHELNTRANRLAHHLRALGVGPETLVGLSAERSAELVVGLLGILKAGGAYLPLDPTYPAERLRFMIEDAQAPVLLTAGGQPRADVPWTTVDLLADWPQIAACPDHNPAGGATPDNLAYVIYTSGSTGRPKGVMIEHRSVLNLTTALHQAIYRHHGGRQLRVSLNAPVSFDASVKQLVTLLLGHALVILPDDIRRDGRALVQFLREQRLDALDCVPSQLKLLLDAGLIDEGQPVPALVLVGGEAIDADTWQRLAQAPQTRFYNVYGPTECTVDSTAIDTRERPDRPTIGRPLANVSALVLDRHGQPVPTGVPGELHIGGAGVARGYWNRPALTAERFIPNPFEAEGWGLGAGEQNGERRTENGEPDSSTNTSGNLNLNTQNSKLYKTGDLCRWLPDGTLEYLGRTDYQVKVRGFRIELDEIEAALRAHPDVREAVVTAREDGGDKRLVAYVVGTKGPETESTKDTKDTNGAGQEEPVAQSQDQGLDDAEIPTHNATLKTHLRERLPEYMVPAAFVWLDALPLSPNGKINHKALPAPDTTRLESDQPYEAPRTQLESLLAGMWAEHFRANRIGIRDNFFELGGNSIQAAVLINRLQEQIGEYVSVIALFEAPTIADLAGYLAQHHGAALAARGLSATEPGTPSAAAGALDTIPPTPRGPDALLPLSFAQQRLWFLDQLEPGSPLYNVPTGVRMRGTLDTAALQRSLDDLVERHESLRTAFGQIDGQPIQLIAPAASLPIAVIDLSDLPAPERETTARNAIVAEAQRPFDLARSPLARATLVRLGQQEHILLLNLHHIVSDGWSMGVLIRELAALYAAHVRGQRAALPPLPVQYADFAVWQRGWFQGHLLEQQLNYWKHKLAGAPAALDLPTDRPRPPVQTFRGATVSFQLPAALSQALATLSRREGATLFMTLLAAFQTLLFRYSGQEDILVGSPIANRTRKEIEGLIGFFVNTLVLRGDLSGNPTFRQLLEQVRETALGAFSHQDLPFEYLVEAIQPERDLSRSPLFQVMLVLQNTPGGALNLPGLTLEALDGEGSTAKFDLLLALVELPSGLAGDLEYNSDLFDRATAERMLAHFQALLEGIVQNPDKRVGDLPLLGAAERARLLGEWNSTAAPYPDLAAHQLVERQAARTPEAVAVVGGAGQLTYADLDTRANRLAHHLLAAGVRPDTPVGICMERSPELVVGILAILKAGAAYVPLDPAYPPERLALMLGDARADVLLTRPGAWAPADGPTVIDLERDWPAIERRPAHAPDLAVGLDQLAYVIYTSGSTGVPKGVAMPHRPLVNLIAWQQTQIPGAARTLQFASPSFDVSFQEIFSTWASGGTLVLPTETLRRDPAELLRFLDEQRVERLFMPFVALQQLAEAIAEEGRAPVYLRDVITAGEQLLITPAIARWFAAEPHPRLHNHYGPSETHVVTAHTLDGDPAAWPGLPPIGRPIANTQAYILDRAGQPAPVGVAGELLFGGDNLARGYLHRPNLTAERFLPAGLEARDVKLGEGDPAQASSLKPLASRWYKTGDLARYRPDGTIEFLGRADTQVKIRGYRIEPGEIETVLAQHPQVREAVVVVRPDPRGAKQLVAYVVLAQGPEAESTKDTKDTNGSEPDSAENSTLKTQTSKLRAFLAQRLPDYMVPATFAVLERWPLTPSGKVDRRALPAPGEGDGGREGFLAPRDALELRIARIWEELLGVQPVGIRESFFELGGHSLLVVRLMSQIQKQLGQKLPLATLFQEATVEHLARSLRQSGAALPRTPLVPIQPGGSRLPFFCVHPGAGNVLSYLELARLLGPDQPFYGLQAAGLDGEAPPRESVDAMAEAYLAALREVQPEGPYLLGGWSFGGMVAYEMARRLTAEGQEVALLALIDSWAPTEVPVPAPDDAALLGWFAADLGRTLGADLRVSAETFAQIAPERRLASVLDQARAAQVLPPDIGEREVEQYIAVFKASLTAMGSYPRRPYTGRATLFRAGDRPLDQAGPTLGWEGLVAGGVALHVLPGDHYSIVRQPHVAALAEQLTACLDEVDAAHGAVGNA